MEKFIAETTKWFEENQNTANAQDLFLEKISEAEAFFAPIYANAAGNLDGFVYDHLAFVYFEKEAESNSTTTNPTRAQLSAPKSGRK